MKTKLICFLFIIIASGCSTVPKSSTLLNTTELQKGKYIDLVSVLPEFGFKNFPITIKEIRVAETKDNTIASKKYCTDLLQLSLLKYSDTFTSKSGKCEMIVSIEKINPGSRAGRVFAGGFGAGNAWIQIDGMIIKNEKRIFAFSDKRKNSGISGLKDFTGDAGQRLIYEMITSFCDKLHSELLVHAM